MDLTARQTDILAALRRDGRVEVDDLALRFDVTTQTIRRDLGQLCDLGLAARTHGGARGLQSVSNTDYRARQQANAAAKLDIAAQAAGLIPDHCSVMLNIGTTTEQVARAMASHAGLVVISNNINIIAGLIGANMRELILVGGSVRAADGAITGPDAVDFIGRYKADVAVIGASALDADGAVLDYDTSEVAVARAILANARTRILVADRTKFDRNAPVRICALPDLDHFVTDHPPPSTFTLAATAAGTTVHIAQTAGAAHVDGR